MNGGRSASPSSDKRTRPFAGKAPGFPHSSDVSDALDDLLAHARATLSQLDALRAQPARQAKATGSEASGRAHKPHDGGPQGAKAHGGQARPRGREQKPGFWRPSCQAHLWRGATHGYMDDLFLDSDDDDLESTESEGSEDAWNFLPRAAPQGLFHPAAQAAHAAKVRGPATAFRRPSSPAQPSDRSSRDRGPSKPASTASSPSAGAQEQFGSRGRRDATPGTRCGGHYRGDAKGGGANGGATRGHAAGFRFGGQGGAGQAAAKAVLTPALPGPEAEVRSLLEAAKSSGGEDSCRQVLKRMLLRWHPDKALQGETAEAKAAQAEATRVLRFILQERERLGL